MNCEVTFCELREKEVINVIDGKRLGRIIDISFTLNGKIIGIIVPGERRLFKGFANGDAIFIPWNNIIKIGEDALLVELVCNTGVCDPPCPPPCSPC